jgi:hypothetical protein
LGFKRDTVLAYPSGLFHQAPRAQQDLSDAAPRDSSF